MLKIEDKAPDFKAEAGNGKPIQLSDFLGKKVVLYFYSKDMTSGCTAEARDFSDNYAKFLELNTVVIGVSKDSLTSHEKFIAKYNLPFVLISDQELEIIRLYGVWKEKNMYGKKTMGVERTTFLIDEKGIIKKIYAKVKVAGHAGQVLQDIAGLD